MLKIKVKSWIKDYIAKWDFTRLFRLLLGVAMLIGYFSTKENIYLLGGILMGAMALLNIGCASGSCQTRVPQGKEPEIKFKKLGEKE